MKPNRFFIVLIPLLAQVLVAGASGHEQKVEYSYSSLPSYMAVRSADGTMGPPEQKIVFGEKMQAEHALTAKGPENKINCPLAYQDVVDIYEKGKKHTFRILAYSGCPFQIRSLSVRKDLVLRKKTKLRIVSTQGGVLQLAKDSSLPFVASSSSLVFMCASVLNVEWSFQNAGMSFETNDAIYTTTKSDASIAFTKDGIKMVGINKKVRKSSK